MATPKKQREYPQVPAIKDEHAKESIRLLWERHHDQIETTAALKTALAAAQDALKSQQSDLSTLKKQMTQVSAGGGISVTSSVGGGGSGGSTGGSGGGTPGGGTPPPPTPAPSDIPNQSTVVAQAKADLIAGGVDITSCTAGGICCGPFQITNLAAFRLGGNYGLLAKDSGQNCNGYSTDIIAVKGTASTMPIFDVLIGSDGPATPTWQFNSYVDTSRWRAPVTPPI